MTLLLASLCSHRIEDSVVCGYSELDHSLSEHWENADMRRVFEAGVFHTQYAD